MQSDKIALKGFDKRTDVRFINEWLKERNLAEVNGQDLPHIGFIAFGAYGAIAAGFLRQCEGDIAILDSLVTNPGQKGELRHSAIDAIVDKISMVAKEMKLKSLVAYSVDASTLERSKKHGFVPLPLTVISKDLSPKALVCE